jgi:biotin carboxylase
MQAAAKLDVAVVVGSDERNPLQDLQPGNHVELNYADVGIGVQQVEAFASEYPLDRLIAVDDAGVRLAAQASRRLELPHNPVLSVEATRNKALLRERLAAAGLPSPTFVIAATSSQASLLAQSLRFPVVLKPLALSGSRAVIRADDNDQFASAFARITRILCDPRSAEECGDLADQILIEGYIPGKEVALEGLLTDGKLRTLAIFDKPDPMEGPFFEETIYVTPSRLPDDDQASVVDMAERSTAAIGLRDGAIHVELRLNEQGVFPVDIAARSIGGLCSRALKFESGLSLEELILRNAIGSEVSFGREANAAGVMMIPIPKGGILQGVAGVELAEAVPLIESVEITSRPGKLLVPLPEAGDYLGFIFARGSGPQEVEIALRRAHELLEFEID